MKKYFLLGPNESSDNVNDIIVAQNQLKGLGFKCESLNNVYDSMDNNTTAKENVKALVEALLECDEVITLGYWRSSATCRLLMIVSKQSQMPIQDFTQFFYNNGSPISNQD